MKKILFILATLALILACSAARPAALPPQPTKAPPTPDKLLGNVETLTWYFEHEHQFKCETSRDHWRCISPDKLVKIVLFNDPVTEATISVPFEAVDTKPARYIQALMFKTGFDTDAWDWITPHLADKEASKEFGKRRVTTVKDDEGWLVTLEWVK